MRHSVTPEDRSASEQALRVVLAAMGAVATVAGARGMVRGAGEVTEAGPFSANIDSECRFYATWYHLTGLVLLRAARRPESASGVVRLVGAGLLAAASARVLSARRLGLPHRRQRVLMVVEFAIPVVVVPWQARVARRASGGPGPRDRRS